MGGSRIGASELPEPPPDIQVQRIKPKIPLTRQNDMFCCSIYSIKDSRTLKGLSENRNVEEKINVKFLKSTQSQRFFNSPKVKNLKLPANRKKETLFEIFSKHKGTSPEDKDTNQYIEHFRQKFTEEITDFVKKRRKSGELDFKSRAI